MRCGVSLVCNCSGYVLGLVLVPAFSAVVFVLLSCCYGLPKAVMDQGVLVLVFGAPAVCWV
jgi:hypothetical protein